MTPEEIRIAIKAVNRWMYHAWNFEGVFHEWKDIFGKPAEGWIPRFIAEIHWDFPIDHAIDKWEVATESEDPDVYLTAFYASLDTTHRAKLIEWVMKNYDSELEIPTDNNNQ